MTIFRTDAGNLDITAYTGPERTDGGNRRRVQVTVVSDEDGKHHSTSLSAEEWRELVREMREQ